MRSRVRPLPGHHHIIDRLAVVNGAVAGFALYPQIYIILCMGVANTLSPLMLWLILGNNIVWSLYGWHRGLVSILLAGVLSALAAAILLVI